MQQSGRSVQTPSTICSNNGDPPTSAVIGRRQLRTQTIRARGWAAGCARCSSGATPTGRAEQLQLLLDVRWEGVRLSPPPFIWIYMLVVWLLLSTSRQEKEKGGKKKHLSWLCTVISFPVTRECEWEGSVTEAMHDVYVCVTGYFSSVYFVWHFVLFCGWHMEWWSCVKNWFEALVNIARCCYWKRTSGWWFHHIIKEWKSIANYILKQTTHYTIMFNCVWTLSGWTVRWRGLEGSQCHGEVSTTLCTAASNTLNTCHSTGLGEQFDIYVTKKPAEDNAVTRLNVALRFSTLPTSKAGLTFLFSFRCRHFDLWRKEPEVACGSLCPWASRWWNQLAERGRNSGRDLDGSPA